MLVDGIGGVRRAGGVRRVGGVCGVRGVDGVREVRGVRVLALVDTCGLHTHRHTHTHDGMTLWLNDRCHVLIWGASWVPLLLRSMRSCLRRTSGRRGVLFIGSIRFTLTTCTCCGSRKGVAVSCLVLVETLYTQNLFRILVWILEMVLGGSIIGKTFGQELYTTHLGIKHPRIRGETKFNCGTSDNCQINI